ncbi:MAG: hypothetical protein JOY77_02140 [Alphaproteobacteria bacterium]|nr:hypothetical protein [Alphaproteobacteria bacterium]
MLKQLACLAAIGATPAFAAALPQLEGNYTFSENDACWSNDGKGALYFDQRVGTANFSTASGTYTAVFGNNYVNNTDAEFHHAKEVMPFTVTGPHAISLAGGKPQYAQFGPLRNGIASSAYVLGLFKDQTKNCSFQYTFTQAAP